jgi:hypothetical protein
MYAYSVECPKIEWEWTNNFQEAIDVWSEIRARYDRDSHIYVWPHVEEGQLYNDNDWIYQLSSRDVIQWWAEELMKEEENMNRVEKRIVKELIEQEYDGMDSVEQSRVYDSNGFYTGDFLNGYAAMIPEREESDVDFHGDFDKMTAEQQDAIINPKHYKMLPAEAIAKHPDGMEYIDLMAFLLEGHEGVQAHLLGQIYKYSMRLGKKDNKLQDAKKIEWYAARLVKEITGELS